MKTPMQWLRRLRAVLSGSRLDREMDEEITFHLEMETSDGVRRGLSPEQARRRAQHAFGGVQRIREEGRDARGVGGARDLTGDLRYALRLLRRAPVFTTVAVATLALGIGANTAIFSVVNTVLLQPLPFPDSRSLVSVWSGGRSRAEFVGIRDGTRTLESVTAYLPGFDVTLASDGEPLRVTSALVTADFFRVLRVQPQLGRFFQVGEDTPGTEPVVVLSNTLWRDRFGGDPAIVGRVIDLDGVSRTVVGVAPPGLTFPSSETRLWIPLPLDPLTPGPYWGAYGHPIIGRLGAGVATAQAREDLMRIATDLQQANPLWRPPVPGYFQDVAVSDLQSRLVRDSRRLLYILLGAVGLVLLMACANVANLLVVRGAVRERELSIRSALGAGSGRLSRQLLIEHLVLAAAGGLAGWMFAVAGVRLLVGLLPATTPRLAEVAVDGWALGFTALLTVCTGLVFGIGPARRLARVAPASALAAGGARVGQGGTQRRLAGALVSGQIAIGVVLAIGAGLLVRSLTRILDVDPGFAAAQVVSAKVNPPRARYATPDEQRGMAARLVEHLGATPGITTAAITTQLPFDQTNQGMAMWVDGWTTDPNALEMFDVRRVSPEFFRTMGIPIRQGRPFTAADGATAPPVAIVSERAVQRFWSGRDAIGGQLRFPWPGWLSIVGVAADVRNNDLKVEALPTLYVPFDQLPQIPFSVVARGTGSVPAVTAAIRNAMAEVAPDTPLSHEQTMEGLIETSLSAPRAAATLLLSFGGLALLLGSVGTYGLVAYGVESRRREFAVRMAIGARGASVMRLVLQEGGRLALIGIVIGVAGAFALSHLMRGLLYETAPTDPVAFVGAPLVLGVTALLACAIPAWRATRVDPNLTLRQE